MFNKMITTDQWGECFFKILPPNMKEPVYPYYQWQIGNNQFPCRDPVYKYVNRFYCFLSALALPDVLARYPFSMLKVCWIGIPESYVGDIYDCTIKGNKAVIYRVKTGEELRKEDSPLYRMYITRMVICELIIEQKIWSHCNEFDWTLFILYQSDPFDFELVPKEYRTSKYVCIAAQLVKPGNTSFVVKDENVVKSLKHFGSIRCIIGWSSHFINFYSGDKSTSILNQVYHPNPVVAQRNLINWIVKEYNRKYQTDYSIPL